MASVLERYVQGECEQVWDELVAPGDQVQAEPLHADALAVARETMRRARANSETLIPRLQRLGLVSWSLVRSYSVCNGVFG